MTSFIYHLGKTSLNTLVLATATLLLAGCGRDDVQVYQVAKESAAPAAMPAGHPEVSGQSAAPQLEWTLPAGWEQVSPGEMRLASFKIKGDGGKTADVGVFPLPGMAGRDIDNVNRWRGQVGLQPVSEADFAKLGDAIQISGQDARVYDLGGENPGSGDKSRILAAIVRREGVAWFFKMTGDDLLVAGQKPAFVDFLKSLKFATTAPAPQAGLPPSHPPLDGAGMGAAIGAAGSSGQAKPVWEVPAGWTEVAGGQFLVAKFTISGDDGAQAAVNVSMSSGDGGGLSGNVNRWRKQLGLAELPDADIANMATGVETSDGKALLTDMTGTDGRTGQKARLVGAMIPTGSRTWFYKLMGSETVVEQQKAAFIKFIQTAKYPNAS